MATIKIKVKGVSEITLTRNYNSLSAWSQDKDDIGFNEAGTAFNDYCMNSTCGNWANDKIIIRSLPDKGYLFYNTNPTGVPSYAPVTLGQEFLTKDLIDYKILKFSAEGNSDNQYSENYLTSFSFERFCGTVSSNEITTIKLNVLDLKQSTLTYNEISRSENQGTQGGNCSPSELVFELTGNLTNYPLNINIGGYSSGASLDVVVNNGSATLKRASDNQIFETFSQPKDGAVERTDVIPVLLSLSGTARFTFNIDASDTIRHPQNNNIVQLLLCDAVDGLAETPSLQFANITIEDNGVVITTLTNQKTMYYN